MEESRDKLEDFLSERLYQVIISNPRKRDGALKVKIRPIMIKGKFIFRSLFPGEHRCSMKTMRKTECWKDFWIT